MANRLTRKIVLLALFLGIQPTLWAQTVAEKATETKPFLWKVKSDQATVYLLGSIHVATKDMYPMHAKVEEAFKASDHLVVEVDAEKPGSNAQGKMMAKMMYPAGDGLSKHLDKDVAKMLTNWCKTKGTPMAAMEPMKMWAVSLMITMTEIQSLGYDTKLGIDKHFIDRARNKKKILELESVASQLSLFESMDKKTQNLLLKQTLLNAKDAKKQMDAMVDSWKAGDAETLQRWLMKSFKDYPALEPLRKKMFDERNAKMAEKIQGYLKQKGTFFVVVGAGHLVGKNSVVDILEQSKLKVQKQE